MAAVYITQNYLFRFGSKRIIKYGAVVDVAIIIIVILDYSKGMFSGFKL